MSFQCAKCHKNIPVFSEFWLREPDAFNKDVVVIPRGKSLPFCGIGCVFNYCGNRAKREKSEGK